MPVRTAALLLALFSVPAFAQSSWSSVTLPAGSTTSSNFLQFLATPTGEIYFGAQVSGSPTAGTVVTAIWYRNAAGTWSNITGNFPQTGFNLPRAFALAPDGSVWLANTIFSGGVQSNEVLYKNSAAGSGTWALTTGGPTGLSQQHIFATAIVNRANGTTAYLGGSILYSNASANSTAFTSRGSYNTPFPYAVTAIAANTPIAGQATLTGTFGYMPALSNALTAGSGNAGNVGTFPIVSGNSTTLVITNASAVTEVAASTAAYNASNTLPPVPDAIGYTMIEMDLADGKGLCLLPAGESEPAQIACGGTTGSAPFQISNSFMRKDQTASGSAGTGWLGDTFNFTHMGNSIVGVKGCQSSLSGCAVGGTYILGTTPDSTGVTTAIPLTNGYTAEGHFSSTSYLFYLGGSGASTHYLYFNREVNPTPATRHLYETANNGGSFTDVLPGLITLFSGCSTNGTGTATTQTTPASDGTNVIVPCRDAGGVWHLGMYGPPTPTPVSIALTPNPFTIPVAGTQTLTCTTTLSDASTRACISPSLTSSDPTKASVSGMVVTGVAAGSGTITGTAESLTSPTDAFTITGGGATSVTVSAGFTGAAGLTLQ